MKRPRGDEKIEETVHNLITGDLNAYNRVASRFLTAFHDDCAKSDVYQEKADHSAVWLNITDIEQQLFSIMVARHCRNAHMTIQFTPSAPRPVCMKIYKPTDTTTPVINFSEIVKTIDKTPLAKEIAHVAGGIVVAMETQDFVATVVNKSGTDVTVSVMRRPEMVIDLSSAFAFIEKRPVTIRIKVNPEAIEFRPSFLRFIN